MSFGESIAPLLGRLAIAWFFLAEVYRYTVDWGGTAILLSMKSVPMPAVLLFVGLVGAVLGSFSLILGYCTRAGAIMLFAIVIAATFVMHDYWHLTVLEARNADYDIFARNVAIAGGLLILIGLGPGSFALDNFTERGGFHDSRWRHAGKHHH